MRIIDYIILEGCVT